MPARICRDQLLGRAGLRGQRRGRPRPRRCGRRVLAGGEASPRTAPRRCTSCGPRRATRSSARTPTAPSRRTTSALDWVVSATKKDFIGKRSLARADTARADRRQLVGLLPVDPGERAARGRTARRRPRARHPDSDGRPRHLLLPQRDARAHVRPGARRGRPRPDRRDGLGAARRPHDRRRDRRPRSLRPGGSSP